MFDLGIVKARQAKVFTPKKRQSKAKPMKSKRSSERDHSLRNKTKINKSSAQLDLSEKMGGNRSENVRSLSGRCHFLKHDRMQREMTVKALKNGILCPDWQAELKKLSSPILFSENEDMRTQNS